MNPEDNNQLQNPLANSAGMPNDMPAMPDMNGSAMMPDNLASAQDSLTAAGMAAGPVPGAMSLDQIAANEPETAASLPLVDEPLVPAAPVPGSIGSAVSMPPADPAPAPGFGAPSAPAASGAPATPMNATPAAPAPETNVSNAAPFNPFAATNSQSMQSAPAAQPAPAPQTTMAGPAPSAPQPAPAPMPMNAVKPKSKLSLSPLVLALGLVSAVLLVTTIIFLMLWMNEKNNVKTVYVPQISDENSDSTISVLSCSRNETHESPSGTGSNTITLSYTGDELSGFSSNLVLDFASEGDASAVRDANAGNVEAMANLAGASFAVSGDVNGNSYAYDINSQDGAELAATDAMNVIYGTTEGEPSLAMTDLQAKYESEGYVCVEE